MITRAAVVVAVVLSLVVAAPAAASDRHPTLSEVQHEVMCPTCKTLLALSQAPIAQRMRAFIRARIAAGETKSQIENQLVAEFGESVLAAPPTHGFGLLAWVLPVVGLLGSAAAVAAVAWRWARAGEHDTSIGRVEPARNGRVGIDPALERKLDEELAQFDC
jgi:cytochrome c-type biogenesis protein CcmH/NrfF